MQGRRVSDPGVPFLVLSVVLLLAVCVGAIGALLANGAVDCVSPADFFPLRATRAAPADGAVLAVDGSAVTAGAGAPGGDTTGRSCPAGPAEGAAAVEGPAVVDAH